MGQLADEKGKWISRGLPRGQLRVEISQSVCATATNEIDLSGPASRQSTLKLK